MPTTAEFFCLLLPLFAILAGMGIGIRFAVLEEEKRNKIFDEKLKMRKDGEPVEEQATHKKTTKAIIEDEFEFDCQSE